MREIPGGSSFCLFGFSFFLFLVSSHCPERTRDSQRLLNVSEANSQVASAQIACTTLALSFFIN